MILQKIIIYSAILYIASGTGHSTPTKKHAKKIKRQSNKGKKKFIDADCVDGFCEKCTAYPSTEVDKLLKENRLSQLYNFYLKQYEVPATRGVLTRENHNLCHIISRTLKPRVARSASMEKEYIVQSENATQSIYMEMCKKTQPKFKLDCLPNDYSVSCVQQYRLIPLLTFDENEKSIRSNQFRVPSGCSVEVAIIRQLRVL